MKVLLFRIGFLLSIAIYAQKPKDGTYNHTIAWAEWEGKSLGATSTVIVKGESIKVVHNGEQGVTGRKGDIFAEGIIMKHRKTGKWIIGRKASDKDATDVGGCTDGPSVIDFRNRIFWSC